MKIIQIFLFILLTSTISYNCKAQESIDIQEQISTYSTQIVNTWVDEDDSNYKLVFLANGTCKEYENNELLTTYNYSIVSNNCCDFSATNTIYLKWIDTEDSQTTCLEILNITDDTLSLMIIDRAKRLFFNKQ